MGGLYTTASATLRRLESPKQLRGTTLQRGTIYTTEDDSGCQVRTVI